MSSVAGVTHASAFAIRTGTWPSVRVVWPVKRKIRSPIAARPVELRTLRHRQTTSVRFSIVESAFLRVFYRFARATIRDFSQQGLVPEDVLRDSGALFLGHIDRDFDVHVIGISLGFRI